MTTTSESRLRQLDELLDNPLELQAEDLEEAIGLCDTEDQLLDERLVSQLVLQSKEDKDSLRRLWAERRHQVTDGVE